MARDERQSVDSAAQGAAARSVRLAAVGDLLLSVDPSGRRPRRDPAELAAGMRSLLQGHDVVLGNLECTLPGDGATVATEPRVVSSPELVRAIQAAGFNVVCLANNHMFDHLQAGFHRLRDLLNEMGIAYFGAGDNLEEAAAPAILEVRGVRVGLLGGADHRSGAPYFAAADGWGVAPLDTGDLCDRIRSLAEQVDHVIISPHWGEERFLIPAPQQIEQARAFIDAGAALVLGHHPHVIQGIERHRGAPIIYSLGNFAAGDVYFSDGDVMTWNRTERTGCLLSADLTPSGVAGLRQRPTFDDGWRIEVDRTSLGDKRIDRANRALARGVTPRRYRRERLWVNLLKPVLAHMRWSALRRLDTHRARRLLLRIRQHVNPIE